MKKIVFLGAVLLTLAGCSNDNSALEKRVSAIEAELGMASIEESNSSKENRTTKDSSSTAESSSKGVSANEKSTKSTGSGESEDFIARGEYVVGEDVEPGSYYIVLSELVYDKTDTDKEAYVSIDISGEETYEFEMLYNLNDKFRVSLKEGDIIYLDDNYTPYSWTIKLLTSSDFKDYMAKSQ